MTVTLEEVREAARGLLEVSRTPGLVPDTWMTEALAVCAEFLHYQHATMLTADDLATERELLRQWRSMAQSSRARDVRLVAVTRELLWMSRRDLMKHATRISFTTSPSVPYDGP